MRYIVTAGSQHYPSKGIGDWVGVYKDYEVAQIKARTLTDDWVHIITITEGGEYWTEIWR